MKKLILLLFLSSSIIQSCGDKIDKQPTAIPKRVVKDSSQTKTIIQNSNAKSNVLQKIPTKNFPVRDRTNFDNFDNKGIADNSLLKQLKLLTIKEEAKNFRIRYKIPFSEIFTSIVVTYQRGDHELFTSLITVNKDNKIINSLDIAYDEIAESAFQKTSMLTRDHIIVTDWNWMTGEPVTESKTYILQKNGKFRKIK